MQGLATNTNHAAGPALVAQPAAYRQMGLRLQYVHTADAIWELAGRRPTVLSIHYGALAQLIGAASSDTGRRHLEHVAAAGVVRIRERRRGLAIVDVVSPEAAVLSWRARLAPPPTDEQLELFDAAERRSVPFSGEQTRKKPASCGEAAASVPAEPRDPEREQFLKLMEVRRQQDPACREPESPPTLAAAFGTPPANVHVSSKRASKPYTCDNLRDPSGAGRTVQAPPGRSRNNPPLRVSAVEAAATALPSDAAIVDGKQAELERRARAPSIKPFVTRRVCKDAVQGRLPFDELLDVVAQADAIERGGGKFSKSRGAYIVGGFRQVYQRHGLAWFRKAQPPVGAT